MHLRKFWSDDRGIEAMEYIIVGGLVVMLLGAALVLLFNAIQSKIIDVANGL